MLRITLLEILAFVLPFALFLLWRWQSPHDAVSRPAPIRVLIAMGAALVILVMISLVIIDRSDQGREGEIYIPPRVVDGELIPGHWEPAGNVGEDTDETGEDEDPPQ